jgi:hypothetical protein
MSVQEHAPVVTEFTLDYELPQQILASQEATAGQTQQVPEVQSSVDAAGLGKYANSLYDEVFRAEAARLHKTAETMVQTEQPDLFTSAAQTAAEKAVADYEAEVARQITNDREAAQLKAESERVAAEAAAALKERQENAEFLSTLSIAELHSLMDGSLAATEHAADFVWDDVVTPMSELNKQFATVPAVEQPLPSPQQSRVAALQGKGAHQFLSGAEDGRHIGPMLARMEAGMKDAFAHDVVSVNPAEDFSVPSAGIKPAHMLHATPAESSAVEVPGVPVPGESVVLAPAGTRTGPRPHADARPRTDVPVRPSTVKPPMTGNLAPWIPANEDVTHPIARAVEAVDVNGDDLFDDNWFDEMPVTREAAPLRQPYNRTRPASVETSRFFTDDRDTAEMPAVTTTADEDLTELITVKAEPAAPKKRSRTRRILDKLANKVRKGPKLDYEDEFIPGHDPRNDPNMVLVGSNYVDRSAVELPRGGMSRGAYRRAMTAEFNTADEETKQRLVANGAAEFDDEGQVTYVNTRGAALPLNREQRDAATRRNIEAELNADLVLQNTVNRAAYQEVGPRGADEPEEDYEARVNAWYNQEMRHIYFDRTVRNGVMASRPVRKFGSTTLKQFFNRPILNLGGHYTREAIESPGGPRQYYDLYPSGGDGQDQLS